MLATLATISGTAVSATAVTPVAAGFIAGVKTWGIGIAASLACGFALKWVLSKGIDLLISWQIGKIRGMLSANTGDAALDAFERDLVLALVKLAQAKMPKDGLGLERKKFVVDFLIAKVPFFKGKEDLLGQIIDEIVEHEAAMLDSIKPG
jgi:hypothetical protein